MNSLSTARKIRIAARTGLNIMIGRPITVSFEITYNCNARCSHCDLGEYVEEPRMSGEVFADWLQELRPAVAQISGGEPTLRKDLVQIVRAMRDRDPVAVFVITTNVQNLNEGRYLELRDAGIDQFSFSLDYPDGRHNIFRNLKNNFQHIAEIIQIIVAHGNDDVVLACVVQSDNFRDLPRMAALAREWGVAINFSTYNSLRTGKEHYLINKPDDLAELKEVVEKLIAMQESGYPIMSSAWTLRQMVKFFATGRREDCRAGNRFLIVTPWGKVSPCGMNRQGYDSREQLRREFSTTNLCDQCYTAIRANSEKSPYRLLLDGIRASARTR